jgi:RNA polymerase sigma-70 factor (ECF subfamily)
MSSQTAKRPLDELLDEELLALIADSNKKAFHVLANRYVSMLYRLARRLISDELQAEDLVQEALLRIWQKAALWRPDGGASVKTWIYRITYNLGIDFIRKNGRISETAFPVEALESEAGTPDKLLQDKQVGELVRQEISSLPDRQKEALILSYYQGLSNAEVAEVMGTTVKGIEALLVRARKKLQARMERVKGVL